MNLTEILKNKKEAIELKKAEVKYCDPSFTGANYTTKQKASANVVESGDTIKRTIVGNTYNYLDSHGDVHVKGCFTKSIKERLNKVFHLSDHEYKLTAKIGEPTAIYEKDIAWKELGVNKNGMTTALMMDTDIHKEYNAKIFNAYKKGQIDQHSVGMVYIKIDLAANTNDIEHVEEKALWDSLINDIANKNEAEEVGYFWVVKECKLLEISAVLAGSNPITPTLENKSIEPSADTQINEPTKVTQHNSKSYNY